SVMLRQPLVHKRVVGGDEIEDAPVVVQDAAEEQLGFVPEIAPQVLAEVRKKKFVGSGAFNRAQLQTLPRQVLNQRIRSPSIRYTCCARSPRCRSSPWIAASSN